MKGVLVMLGVGIIALAAGRILESSGVHSVGSIVSIGAGLLLASAHVIGIWWRKAGAQGL